ncbi:MAG: hypothetical protein GXP33_16160 [Spirochaetes bacterium]|nr:hypothetical protein [Spirochaetota bacterium]
MVTIPGQPVFATCYSAKIITATAIPGTVFSPFGGAWAATDLIENNFVLMDAFRGSAVFIPAVRQKLRL